MIIGMFLDDKGFEGINLTDPNIGNPGIGGTQYCFAMLMYYLSKIIYYQLICYHIRQNMLPKNVQEKIVSSELEAIKAASDDGVDILVIKSPTDPRTFRLIDTLKLKTISWAHNYLLDKSLKLHKETKFIKRVVFVGRQEYDRYIDDDIISKSDYIYNMYKSNNNCCRRLNVNNIVTYTGSLVKQKGFHILAQIWKEILKEVPDAQLFVIGSGNLYNENELMGKYKIAQESYEKEFIPYLLDDEGRIDVSVRFMGKLGIEKRSVFEITKVGVVNPTARTETFGLSAVEMSEYSIPVCTKGVNGLLDTVINGYTGLLSCNKKSLKKNIIRLLKDDVYNIQLGNQGKKFIQKFEPERIVNDWIRVIKEVYEDRNAEYKKPNNNLGNNFKWARIANRFLRMKMHLKFVPSIAEIEMSAHYIVNLWR